MDTLINEMQTLRKYANSLGNKNFIQASEKDTMKFFEKIKIGTVRNQYGNQIMAFYRWLLKLDKRVRPENMRWFSHKKPKDLVREKSADPKEFFIFPEDYKKILDVSNDRFGLWEALWETYYLSGARESEVLNMKVGDVIINDDGKVSIKIRQSKTRPRTIPLTAIPNNLIRWLNNHIKNIEPRVSAREFIKQKPKVDLWISLSNRRYGLKINKSSVIGQFIKIRTKAGVRKSISIHCFRKTRASIMFSARTKDGGIIYDDTQMGYLFGWKPETVGQRRQEYDLRNYEDLQKEIFNNVEGCVEDYDTLKQQNTILLERQKKEKDKQIAELELKIKNMEGESLVDKFVDKLNDRLENDKVFRVRYMKIIFDAVEEKERTKEK